MDWEREEVVEGRSARLHEGSDRSPGEVGLPFEVGRGFPLLNSVFFRCLSSNFALQLQRSSAARNYTDVGVSGFCHLTYHWDLWLLYLGVLHDPCLRWLLFMACMAQRAYVEYILILIHL